MHISRWLLGPALVLSLISLPSGGADAAPQKSDDSGITATPLAKPKVKLDGPKRSKAALKALAGQLDTAAAVNRTSARKLAAQLEDPTAWIAANGRLFYADTFERSAAARTSTSSTTSSIPPAPEPLASTFQLHSKPGSDHTIFLDFNGVTLGAGGWTLNGFKKGTYQGFSLDSDYATFSDSERAYVQHAWRVVSEKYAPFDIDVTTQNPGADAYNRNGEADLTYGDHVVFTDVATGSGAKPAAVCPAGCDGVAFTGTFDDPEDNLDLGEPVWVYTGNYHGSSRMSGEIASHEIGHSLGLSHDGLGTGDGDFGSGNDAYYAGDNVWSPVMGSGIGALMQFNPGDYPNASNTEDDFQVIQDHGAPLRADDWGDLGSPTDLGAQMTYAVDGIIESSADTDVFTITHACSSPIFVKLEGIGDGTTLPLRLTVRAPSDNTVLSQTVSSPYANMSTIPRTPREADVFKELSFNDTFLLEVDGGGAYGNVGQYHLTVTGCDNGSGAAPGTPYPVTGSQPDRTGTLNLSWSTPSSPGDSAITAYRITGLPSGTIDVAAEKRSETFTGLTPGTDYDIAVAAVNKYGAGTPIKITQHMNTWGPTGKPALKASAYGTTVALSWTEPANPGRANGMQWTVSVWAGSDKLDEFPVEYGYPGVKLTGVGNGHYTLKAKLFYESDAGYSTPANGTYSGVGSTTVDVGPSAPRIGTPSSGTAGGTATATARWAAPYTLRGQKISSYTVGAYKLNSSNQVVKLYVSSPRSATSRSYVWALPAGRYKFRVQAHSQGGYTPISAYSTIATSR